jgi:hypothetical protein
MTNYIKDILSLFLLMIWGSACIFCLLTNNVLMGLFIMFVGYVLQGIYMMYQNSKETKKY